MKLMAQAENPNTKHDLLTPFRHLVLAAIAALIHPFWLIGFNTGFQQSVGIFVGSVVIAAVITGLTYLFFTKGTGKDWRGNFYRSLWVLIALMLLGHWVK